jgi:hypothetical protein
MRYCPYCKHSTQRWGKSAAGTARYFCPACNRTTIRRARTRIKERQLRYELDLWLGGKDNLREIAERYHSTRQTLWRHFRPIFSFPFEPSIPRQPAMHTLILDATYIHGNSLCALVAIDERDRVFWRFAKYESFAAWANFLSNFPEPAVLVMDGQKGLFAAARTLWPHVRIQRCQFHVISFALQHLGRRPKDEVGKVMLHLLYTLKEVKTPERRDLWLRAYRGWETRYERFFNARNKLGAFEYPRLRSVRFVMRKALPNLFTYIDIPDTPNTTNLVEGWVNSAIAEALRRHRGLHEHEKKTLVAIVLSHLKRGHQNKPQQRAVSDIDSESKK